MNGQHNKKEGILFRHLFVSGNMTLCFSPPLYYKRLPHHTHEPEWNGVAYRVVGVVSQDVIRFFRIFIFPPTSRVCDTWSFVIT